MPVLLLEWCYLDVRILEQPYVWVGMLTGMALLADVTFLSLYLGTSLGSQVDYSKTFVKWPLSKRPKFFKTNYCLLQVKCIKLPFVIKTFVLSIFEWQFYTCFTVLQILG